MLFTDRLLEMAVPNVTVLTRFQNYKGGFFVLLTSIILYYIVHRALTSIAVSQQRVQTRTDQQEIVTSLGLQALEGADLDTVMEDAVGLVADVLNAEHVVVLELLPGGEELAVRAASGDIPPLVQEVKLDGKDPTQIGYALFKGGPLVIEDFRLETRFSVPPQLLDGGMVSGVAAVIHGKEQPFGVLAVHSTTRRDFGEDDVNFLQAVANVLADAIERRDAETRLHEQLDFTGAITDSLAEGLLVVDANMKLTFMNPSAENILGWREADVLGRDIHTTIHHRSHNGNGGQESLLDCDLVRVIGGEVLHAEADTFTARNGHAIPVEVYASPVVIGGQARGAVIAFRDITSRQQAEAALRESEERFRGAFDHAAIGMALTSPDGHWLRVNSALCRILGRSEEELVGTTYQAVSHPDDIADDLHNAGRLINGEIDLYQTEKRYIHSDGHVVWVSLNVSLVRDLEGNPLYFISQMQDITERKADEQHMQEQAQAEAHLLAELMTAQEAERRRLSMDIHDGPLQSLGVAIMAVDRALRRQERGEEKLVAGELHELRTTLAGTVDDVRAVLADLSLDMLSSYGLAPALRNQSARFADVTGISVEIVEEAGGPLPEHIQLLMYRLAQEALANVRKHANASRVTLTLKRDGNHLRMTIADDGKGFDVDQVLEERTTGEKIGLRSMRQRVRNAQGDLVIRSAPGQGTTLDFWCPLPTKHAKARSKPS